MKPQLLARLGEMQTWRRDLHRRPELAFREERTSRYVEEKLRSFGVEVHGGIAKTGLVGVIRAGEADDRAIGLRADLDALPLQEFNEFDHRSESDGVMHACGHDGHMAMLLGAAGYLAETRDFSGTACLIFQPAEEGAGGGRAMIEEGLFARFPVAAVYGLHNWPGIPAGEFAIRPGPMMASMDTFEIAVSGHGCHAAMPHLGCDPIVVAASIVNGLQTIASRAVSATDSIVVSVTQIHAGEAWNVIPEEAVIRGTVRTLEREVRNRAEHSIRRIADGIAAAHGASARTAYVEHYPVTVNTPAETEFAATVAAAVAGQGKVRRDLEPAMGAEDFAFMLEQKPGAYIWLGNGPAEQGRVLHSPHYDFNDETLPVGASYWAELVERALPKRG
jgi:amidohydrolase